MLTFEVTCPTGGVYVDLYKSVSMATSEVAWEVRIQRESDGREGYKVYLRPCRCDRYNHFALFGKFICTYSMILDFKKALDL